MAKKIQTSELHLTPSGKLGFFHQLQRAVQCVREEMGQLKGSRKANTTASGALHGLALMAAHAGSRRSVPVTKMEVDYWEETFLTWFKSTKRYFDDSVRDAFLANAAADFALIRERADTFSAVPWEQKADVVQRSIEFVNREAHDAACEAANQRYPVELGIALDKYLKACARRLVSEEDLDSPLVVTVKEKAPEDKPGTVAPRIICFPDGVHSLVVTSFGGFGSPKPSGTGLQKKVKKYLKDHAKETLSDLTFDSESSMFCVRSDDMSSLSKVAEVLYTLASDAIAKD